MPLDTGDLALSLSSPPPGAPLTSTRPHASRPFPPFDPESSVTEGLARWIKGFALVHFDLDTGPALSEKDIYPPSLLTLSASERALVAFSSLPDGVAPSQVYSWRIPAAKPSEKDSRSPASAESEQVEGGEEEDGCWYGFVWFEKMKDPTSRRGFRQSSLVLLTKKPHHSGLFTYIITQLGPMFFKAYTSDEQAIKERGLGPAAAVIEGAVAGIAGWPAPTPGATFDLPLMGSVQTFSFPINHQPQWHEHRFSSLQQSQSFLAPSSAIGAASARLGEAVGLEAPTGQLKQRPQTSYLLPSSTPLTPLSKLLSSFAPINVAANNLNMAGTTFANISTTINKRFSSSFSSMSLNSTSTSPTPTSLLRSSAGASSAPLPPPPPPQATRTLSYSQAVLLWELVITGEPIVLFGPNQRDVSDFVLHLVGAIRPIVFEGAYKPYFHIQDPDFGRLMGHSGGTKPPAATLLGCTNPHVLNSCKNWPNVVKLSATSGGGGGGGGGGTTPQGSRSSSPSREMEKGVEIKSPRKRHVLKDEAVAKEIEKAVARNDFFAADQVLLRHLALLTEQFLTPLNRYLSTLHTSAPPPPLGAITPSLEAPGLHKAFDLTEFFASLRAHGSPLLFRASTSTNFAPRTSTTLGGPASNSLERFYQRFLHSPNFASWLHRRIGELKKEVKRGYLERLEKADVSKWGQGRNKQEVDELARRMEMEASLTEAAIRMEDRVSGGPPSPEKIRSVRLRQQADQLRDLSREREKLRLGA